MSQSYAQNRPKLINWSDDHIIEIHNSKFRAGYPGTRGPQPPVFRTTVGELRKQIQEGAVSENTIYVDAVNGNDEKGTIGSKANAFKSIKAARDYAILKQPGRLIHILEGVYLNEHNLTYDGVMYFEPNTHIHSLAGSDSGGTRRHMFFVNDSGQQLPYADPLVSPNLTVLGHGNFYATKATDIATGGWTFPIIAIYNRVNDNKVYFECNSVHSAPSGGAIKPGAGKLSVRIREGVYATDYLEHPSNGTGTILIQTGQVDDAAYNFDLKCPYMRVAGRALDHDKTLGSYCNMDIGVIETYADAGGDATLQFQPSHDTDSVDFNLNIDTIINPVSRAMFWVDCEAGKFNIDIKKIVAETQAVYFLNRANIAATDQLQVNLRVGQAISKTAAPIHMYNLQDDAKYFIEGNYRTLADDQYCIRLDKNVAGALVQLDGTYINEGTDPAAYTLFVDAGEVPPVLGNVQFHSIVETIHTATSDTDIELRGSVWLQNETTDHPNLTGIYMVGKDTKMPGRGDVVRSATVNLNSAEILALDTTPIELVPAPGAGFALIPISAYIKSTFLTSAYENGASLDIKCAGADEVALKAAETALKGTVTIMHKFFENDSPAAASQITENKALELDSSVAFINGLGSAQIVISYKVVKF